MLLRTICVIALAAMALQPGSAQPTQRVKLDAPSRDLVRRDGFRVDSPLVLVPAQVTTFEGAPVMGLDKNDFHLLEDGNEQKITYFSLDDAPLSIGLLIDSSGSMQSKMRKTSEAAATFFKTANREDEFFLIEFNDRPKLTVPFTTDSDEILQRIQRVRPFGRTSLLDALRLGMTKMKDAQNSRRVIVILSDGGDNHSHVTAGEIKSAILEADVQVYAMGIFDGEEMRKRPIEEQNGPKLLDTLTELTGGRHYRVDNIGELPEISERISKELRNQYVLGYHPANDVRDGKYRRIKLSMSSSAAATFRLQYRRGYRAPVE